MPERRPIDSATIGTWLAVLAALCYTASIVELRQLAGNRDLDWAIWVSCLKALPVYLAACVGIAFRRWKRRPVWPSRRVVIELLLTGLFMQFAGNVAFQVGLSLGGMALSVPLSFATMMVSGAVLARAVIGEPITPRSLAAMTVLVVAIGILSLGAEDVLQSVVASDVTLAIVVGAILTASLAGCGWGISGVVVRRVVTRDVAVSTTVFLLSLTGVVGLGLTCLLRKGPQWLIDNTSEGDLQTMLLAGMFTAVAFFSLTEALRRITVIQVNLLNASQIAMTSIAGVVLYNERMTGWLIGGSLLTVVGLMIIDRPQKEVKTPD